jgi:hypothetical protein
VLKIEVSNEPVRISTGLMPAIGGAVPTSQAKVEGVARFNPGYTTNRRNSLDQ